MSAGFSKALRSILLIFALHLSLFLIMYPSECIETGKNAVNLCLTSVIPALFPFLICSGFFSATGAASACSRYLSPFMRPVFGVPGCGAMAFVLGIVSGYPVGAVCAADLYASGQCTKAEAERMCAFCSNSGPLFIMSVVGYDFLGCPQAGKYLYLAHILSAVLSGMLLRFCRFSSKRSTPLTLPAKSVPDIKSTVGILGNVMDSAIPTMLKICGFIVFFTIFAASLPKCSFTPFLHSLLEITGGIKQISALDLSFDAKLCIISFFAAFSGVSVMLQVGAVTAPYGLSAVPYALGKPIQGIISAAITKVLLCCFPIKQFTFAHQKCPAAAAAEPLKILNFSLLTVLASLMLFAVLIAVLKFFRRRRV